MCILLQCPRSSTPNCVIAGCFDVLIVHKNLHAAQYAQRHACSDTRTSSTQCTVQRLPTVGSQAGARTQSSSGPTSDTFVDRTASINSWSSSSGPPVTLIVAIVLGCLLAVTLAGMSVCFVCWRRRSPAMNNSHTAPSTKSTSNLNVSVDTASDGRWPPSESQRRTGVSIVAPSTTPHSYHSSKVCTAAPVASCYIC